MMQLYFNKYIFFKQKKGSEIISGVVTMLGNVLTC